MATDIEALRAKRPEDIDLSDIPELEPGFLAQATFHPGKDPTPFLLWPDDEIAAWLIEKGADAAEEEIVALLREHIRKQRGAA